ncbi:hypothetical protein C448_03601 [Halococcus morrhuae DSM 1307]|uniref:Uncharacterized protein n=1 Tax=Halococcus morrhuae DSM 1307 TaxID=931277 RepID=M0MU81_HALMO|nr:DUF6360 family protein [Halococcus morrhuae]EMA48329.1 hypothetical protein C448_03601 [Halococcus morrhuae DSM 1307]
MSDRILKVNAYTTLDLLDGRAEGHGFEEDALAVLNVTADRKNPDAVKLQLELDNTDLDAVPAHADEIELTPEQARTVAAALEERAETVEGVNDD